MDTIAKHKQKYTTLFCITTFYLHTHNMHRQAVKYETNYSTDNPTHIVASIVTTTELTHNLIFTSQHESPSIVFTQYFRLIPCTVLLICNSPNKLFHCEVSSLTATFQSLTIQTATVLSENCTVLKQWTQNSNNQIWHN